MLGAQLRTDFFLKLDGRGLNQLDDYFSLAAGLNITCVQVPVCWSDICSDDFVRIHIIFWLDITPAYRDLNTCDVQTRCK